MRRGPFDGFRRFFDRSRSPLSPRRRGLLDDLDRPRPYGSSFGFGYGRDRAIRIILLAIVILLVGIYLGRHWNEFF